MPPNRLRQRQQSQGVGDMAAAFAQGLGEVRLSAAKFLRQSPIGLSFFERCQIFALEVLDQRDLQHLGIAENADQHRHLVQPGALRRAPAPLTGDQLERRASLVDRPHEQRLQDPLLAHRLRQRLEFGLIEMTAWLKHAGPDQFDSDLAHPRAVADASLGLAEECRETPPERLAPRAVHAAPPASISSASLTYAWAPEQRRS